jgi:hypothetical protein
LNRAAELYRRHGFCEADETETHLIMAWVPEAAR